MKATQAHDLFCYIFYFQNAWASPSEEFARLASMTAQEALLGAGDSGGLSWDSLGEPFCSPSEHDSS